MPTEISLAILGIVATIVGAMVYTIRLWADAKTRQAAHELEMTSNAAEHDRSMERTRVTREEARIERDLKTVEYIQCNTDAMRGLVEKTEAQTRAIKEMQKAIQSELGNGISGLLRQIVEYSSGARENSREILDIVRELRRQDTQTRE